jgi:hypothetical protein
LACKPTYTLAGFDLTTHSSSLLGGRRRRYYILDHAAKARKSFFWRRGNFDRKTAKHRADSSRNWKAESGLPDGLFSNQKSQLG